MLRFRTSTVRSVDIETGEVYEGNQILIPPKKPGIDGDFVMARQEGLFRLAKEADLGGQDYKILLMYLGCLDFENYLQVEQKWIADELGIAYQSVHRSTKKLVKAHILVEGQKVGKHKTYRLNEWYGWKGDSRKYQEKVMEGTGELKKKTSKSDKRLAN